MGLRYYPGCFDDDSKTFIDLYMKSGLYPAEIVRRLYTSTKMKQKYPDDNARLQHIFSKQVYGLAPTSIIYRIAMNFIFGFNAGHKMDRSHFKLCNTLPYAEMDAGRKTWRTVWKGKLIIAKGIIYVMSTVVPGN